MSFLIQGFFYAFLDSLVRLTKRYFICFYLQHFLSTKIIVGYPRKCHMPPTGLRSLSTNGNERKKAKIVVAIRPFRMIDQNDQGRTTREKKKTYALKH